MGPQGGNPAPPPLAKATLILRHQLLKNIGVGEGIASVKRLKGALDGGARLGRSRVLLEDNPVSRHKLDRV